MEEVVEPATTPPALSCSCRAARCAVSDCQKCSRCGCEHSAGGEGQKLPRKRGRPPGPAKRKAQRAVEATASPGLGLRPRPDVSYVEPEEDEDEGMGEQERGSSSGGQIPSALELMRILGLGPDKVDYVRKNMGSAALRQDRRLWELHRRDLTTLEQRARSVVSSLYMDVLSRLAESLCGIDAAESSIEFLRHKFGAGTKAARSVGGSPSLQHMVPLVTAYMATKKGSLERRVTRALMAEAFTLGDLEAAQTHIPGFHLSRTSYRNGKAEYTTLCEEGALTEEKSSRAKFDAAVADKVIQSILDPSNVSFLSWSGRRIKLDGNVVPVPSIRRNKPINVMYRDYKQAQGEGGATVSTRTFYRMCAVLARRPESVRPDSVNRLLLDDSFDRIKSIIHDNLPGERDSLEKKLLVAKDWLKYACFSGDPSLAGCPRHDPTFGLTSSQSCPAGRVSCTPCLMLHTLFNYISGRLEEAVVVQATLGVLRDCFNKIEVFMGHQLRVAQQHVAIDHVADQIKARCVSNGFSTEALVVVDFKSKVAPLFSREQEPANGGETPFMSWHSTMVRFWSVDEKDRANTIETKVYFDHIAQQREEKTAIVALVESVIVAIRRDLPHITSIILQSDNASCYQNAVLPVVLPLLGAANGLTVSRFIHTEAESGASDLDAHIARALQRISVWVDHGNNCTSAEELVQALTSDDGMPNCVAQLVEYDVEALKKMAMEVDAVERSFAGVVGHVNDIFYAFPADAPPPSEIKASPIFQLRASAYSGVDTPVIVDVNIVDGLCAVVKSDGDTTARIGGELAAVSYEDDGDDSADGEAGDAIYNDTMDDLELDADDESNMNREIVLPANETTRVSRAKVITAAQIRMRSRTWKDSTASTTFLPASGSSASADPQMEEKDIVAYTKRAFHGFNTSQQQIGSVAAVSLSDQMLRLCEGTSFSSLDTLALSSGWAHRPARSTLYGSVYVGMFASEIDELRKHRPTKLLEALQLKYPGRYDLPSLDDIKAALKWQANAGFILALPTRPGRRPNKFRMNSSPDSDGNGPDLPTSKRQRLDAAHAGYLEGLVSTKANIKPNEALQAFREKFPGSEAEAPDDRVKAKVSNLKSKDKRLNG